MPDLNFRVIDVEPGAKGILPLLHFHLEVTNRPSTEQIQSVMLQTQIQIEAPRRFYNPEEKEKLSDLFGEPERWGQTLRNQLWTHANMVIPSFEGERTFVMPISCPYDLNITAAKYFYALEEGEVPLLFLFSGTVFYKDEIGQLQAAPISWNTECSWRMSIDLWKETIEQLFPNIAWITLERDLFEKLYAYRRRYALPTWERAIEQLLAHSEEKPGRERTREIPERG